MQGRKKFRFGKGIKLLRPMRGFREKVHGNSVRRLQDVRKAENGPQMDFALDFGKKIRKIRDFGGRRLLDSHAGRKRRIYEMDS